MQTVHARALVHTRSIRVWTAQLLIALLLTTVVHTVHTDPIGHIHIHIYISTEAQYAFRVDHVDRLPKLERWLLNLLRFREITRSTRLLAPCGPARRPLLMAYTCILRDNLKN
jgi:hypothetical protein